MANAPITQAEHWDSVAGPTWVAFQDELDRQLDPLGLEAMRALAPISGERILDVGCGCGQTSIELASHGATVHGVDISAPMLELARTRARGLPIELELADAQIASFGASTFDAVYSRFGVMFFADNVAAFANLAKAVKPGGRLAFVCWRALTENDWVTLPMQAALPLLPPLPPPDPLGPGPGRFADADHLRGMLDRAGWSAIRIDPFDAPVGAGSVDHATRVALKVGPLGAALRANPELTDAVAHAIRDVFARHVTADGVQMKSAVWIVTARRA